MQETEAVAVTEPVGLDSENVAFFGIVPVAGMLLLALALWGLHTIRKRKNWRDLSDAMRLDDAVDDPNASLKTGDLEEMDPTRPSQRLSQLKRDE